MEIKVLGPGCPKCQQTEKVVREAMAETGVQASIEKVIDVMKHAYPVDAEGRFGV